MMLSSLVPTGPLALPQDSHKGPFDEAAESIFFESAAIANGHLDR